MSLTSPESVCQRFKELHERLEKLKGSWTMLPKRNEKPAASSFQRDWHARWLRIVAGLRELDQALNRTGGKRNGDRSHPAILQFPLAEDGILSMEPF